MKRGFSGSEWKRSGALQRECRFRAVRAKPCRYDTEKGRIQLAAVPPRGVFISAAQQGSLSPFSNVLSISTAPAVRRTSSCLCWEASPLLSFRHGTQKLSHIEAHCTELSLRLKGVDTPLRARHSASCISVSPAKSVAPLSEMRRQARDLEKSRRRHSPVLGGRAARNRG